MAADSLSQAIRHLAEIGDPRADLLRGMVDQLDTEARAAAHQGLQAQIEARGYRIPSNHYASQLAPVRVGLLRGGDHVLTADGRWLVCEYVQTADLWVPDGAPSIVDASFLVYALDGWARLDCEAFEALGLDDRHELDESVMVQAVRF